RDRLLHVKGHGIDQVDLVAEAGQPRHVRARPAAHVEDAQGRSGQPAQQDLLRARPLDEPRARGEAPALQAALVVRTDLFGHAGPSWYPRSPRDRGRRICEDARMRLLAIAAALGVAAAPLPL